MLRRAIIISMAIVMATAWSSLAKKPSKKFDPLDFYVIRTVMKNSTDLHWQEYVEYLKGKRVTWTGWVQDVEKQWWGGYKILIDMDPPNSISVQDVYIENQPKEIATQFHKNQKVRFSGDIASVLKIMGGSCAVTLENVEIGPADNKP